MNSVIGILVAATLAMTSATATSASSVSTESGPVAVVNEKETTNNKTVEEVAKPNSNEVEIYFVRHGKTMFNTTSQVQGWADSPLTDVGINQAIESGKGLEDIKFTTAYSSDMGRARATAKLILESNKNDVPQLKELIGLREWGYGGYEGRDDSELWIPLYKEVGVRFESDWSTWEEFTSKMTDEQIANGIAKNDPTQTAETYEEIIARSKDAVEEIIKETLSKGGGKALAVSHGSEIPTILNIYVPKEYNGESIGNCSLTILKYKDGNYSLELVGDKTYMDK